MAVIPSVELRTVFWMSVILITANLKFRNRSTCSKEPMKRADKVCGDFQDLKSPGTDGSTGKAGAKAATCMFLDVDLRSTFSFWWAFCQTEYGAFCRKANSKLASTSFCSVLEANRGVSGGASQKSIQFVPVEKLQKLHTDHRMQCFNLGASLRRD